MEIAREEAIVGAVATGTTSFSGNVWEIVLSVIYEFNMLRSEKIANSWYYNNNLCFKYS